jgi:isopropylmalate/homocitrate/citramalate synthase
MVQGTFPPLFGERAGNADLIQIIMNIKKRSDYYPFSVNHINTNLFGSLVRTMEDISGKRIPPHYPIVGRLVHTHSSGIHQH